MKKKIHFAWFAGTFHGPHGWDAPHAAKGYDWREPELYVKMASICEQGMFDFILFADGLGISSSYQSSIDTYVKYGLDGVCHDPTILAGIIAAGTKHIGVGTTVTTSLMPPYIMARQAATLDHLTKGRIATNIVTGTNIAGYLNCGFDELVAHDDRYDIADEYLELCFQLWNSWERDAVVMNKETGIFADPGKVHPINFEGKHYKSRGPLNVAPSPQGRPTIIQAGASERGKEFAARWADAVIVGKNTVDEMKAYYDDLKGRVVKYGRNPDELKIFFLIKPVVGETEEIAHTKSEAQERSIELCIEYGLAALSYRLGIDLSKFNLDEPLPMMDVKSIQGNQSIISQNNASVRRPTLRQMAIETDSGSKRFPILGNPEQVADKLQEMMEAVGGDGFALTVDSYNHDYMQEFVNTVIPVLQERDLMRKEYTHKTLREHLLEF